MIIERNLARFIVFAEETLLTALEKISANKARIVFLVSAGGKLEGVLTDGDVRRWIVETRHYDVSVPVSSLANRQFVSMLSDSDPAAIEACFSDRIDAIPLVDRQMHLVAVARAGAPSFRIGEFTIAADAPAFVIAEIGNNHNGDVALACRLVDLAAEAGADCAKFQMRSMASLYRAPGTATDLAEDLGAQYTMDLLARFQLAPDDLFRVFDHCRARGILPLCTPWDHDSLAALDAYGLAGFKIASADLTNHELLRAAAATRRPLILSTGMSSEAEILDAVRLLRGAGAQFAMLHCNSTYPAPFKDVNLNYIPRLARLTDAPVGYSGHERGIAVAIAAVAVGARIVEKHFTVDRAMEGNDHRVSLLPPEFTALVEGIREVEAALGGAGERRITQGEMMNREVLAKSLVVNRAVVAGETIVDEMIDVKSPGRGLQPNRRAALVGRRARRDMAAGEFFYVSDLGDGAIAARPFTFRRPFGVPVRYHDVAPMAAATNLDLVEFHLSYKDMDEDPAAHLGDGYDLDFVVHSPELFAGDHIIDLCSPDAAYRARSIAELQRVVDLTRRLKPFFRRSGRPMIVLNAGGFSADRHIPAEARAGLYDAVAEALAQIDAGGVEIIPQTMPPFPWHFGGQRYHNLFMSADDIAEFCARTGMRVCLDVSHSALACTHFSWSFNEFLDTVSPLSAHIHLVDAAGIDGEGLQIGDGTVDFAMVAAALDRHAPQASFIPEIWQGHKDDGAGFWTALDRLEAWF